MLSLIPLRVSLVTAVFRSSRSASFSGNEVQSAWMNSSH
jgi:hypothetical protein